MSRSRPRLSGRPPVMASYWERWSAVVFLTTLMQPDDRGSIVVTPRPAWMASAACSRAGTADYFPTKGRAPTAARAICRSCPVQAQCLDYAMADEDLAGVWGGTTERERGAMRAQPKTRAG